MTDWELICRSDDDELTEEQKRRIADDLDPRKVTLTRADTIVETSVRWLWKGRVPLGELTLIAGKGSVGKSTLLCEMTAWITRGDMKGEYFGQPRDVIYIANEDSLKHTVVPRLKAAGADMARVHFVAVSTEGQAEKLTFPRDLERIARGAREKGAVAIMVDPLSSNVEGARNKQDDMRPVFEAIQRAAETYGLAFLGLAHTRKGQSSDLLEAIMGSSEQGNVCRSVMGAMRDPDEDGAIVLSQEKMNLGRDMPSYKYKIVSAQWLDQRGEMIDVGRIEWLGKTDLRVGEMIADQQQPATREASDFLRDYLTSSGGEAAKRDVTEAARKEGIAQSTLERAARKMRIRYSRTGYPATSMWHMPLGPE